MSYTHKQDHDHYARNNIYQLLKDGNFSSQDVQHVHELWRRFFIFIELNTSFALYCLKVDVLVKRKGIIRKLSIISTLNI